MTITRRQFLIGGAAGAATSALGVRPARAELRYDLCVIGSGFAGIHLALRAVAHGLTTVVVEAGSDLAPSFTYTTTGEVRYPVAAARYLGAGGTSALWSGATSRMWPHHFRVHTRFGSLLDWPIGYEDLAPYYCESEQLLAAEGFAAQPGAEPPRVCAYPHEHDSRRVPVIQVGRHRMKYFVRARSRRGEQPVRLAEIEVPRFAASKLGTLLAGQRATEIVTRDGHSVDHVVTRDRGGSVSRVSARRFVVAAGVVESPRLLLASRSRWFPGGLGNDHGLVGRHFCYHPHIGARSTPPGDVAFRGRGFRSHSLDATLLQGGMNACNVQLNAGPDGVLIQFSPDTEPHPDNRLTLVPDRPDAMGLPAPNLHVTPTARDRNTIGFAKQFGGRLSRTLGGADQLDYWRRYHSHPSGTCRMAADASSGVVDRNNRVFGVENLYVSGAAVFPLGGATNPTNTVVAMTLRLADHLIAAG